MDAKALGFIETSSYIGAIEAANVAVRTAKVTVAAADILAAGVITVRFEGELADVQAAVEAGARAAEQLGVSVMSRVIPRPAPGLEILLSARLPEQGRSESSKPKATRTMPRTAPAAQPVPEAAPVARTAPKPKPKPEPAAAPPAISEPEAKTAAAPVERVAEPAPKPPKETATVVAPDDFDSMPVTKLRSYARTLSGLPIQGREISMANKQQLLAAIRSRTTDQ